MRVQNLLQNWLNTHVPGIALLRNYPRDFWSHDWRAGLSVAAVAIPVGVAYAQLAGMSPIAGLYASILPMVAYALFGSSRQLMVSMYRTSKPICRRYKATLLALHGTIPG